MKSQFFLKLTLCLLSLFFLFECGSAAYFPNVYPSLRLDAKMPEDVGHPLLITPYLRNGLISLAQKVSRVPLTDNVGIKSHAGFFTIDAKYNSNLYFWYFPPVSKKTCAPIILWLQGGPGASSLFGLFDEIGPLLIIKDGFTVRKHHWALDYHLLFIDNPVGTGFSFTNGGYCFNEECVANGLYRSLQQFFKLFPDIKKNNFFIAGESYAGKYLTSLGMKILQENDNIGEAFINLRGIAMGNAYCDPINQIGYGNYLYQHGLIDSIQLEIFTKYEAEIAKEIKANNWVEADILMDRLMNGGFTNFSYFKYYTGFDYYYNYLQTKDSDNITVFTKLLHEDIIRRSVHVGGLPFNDGEEVQMHLTFDVMQSVAPNISVLLSYYPIMFYSGQLDILVAFPLTENVLSKLKFAGSKDYREAPRQIWMVNDEIAGYWKSGGNLTNVLVRNAGHMVPADQPKWALAMIRKFINDTLTVRK